MGGQLARSNEFIFVSLVLNGSAVADLSAAARQWHENCLIKNMG